MGKHADCVAVVVDAFIAAIAHPLITGGGCVGGTLIGWQGSPTRLYPPLQTHWSPTAQACGGMRSSSQRSPISLYPLSHTQWSPDADAWGGTLIASQGSSTRL